MGIAEHNRWLSETNKLVGRMVDGTNVNEHRIWAVGGTVQKVGEALGAAQPLLASISQPLEDLCGRISRFEHEAGAIQRMLCSSLVDDVRLAPVLKQHAVELHEDAATVKEAGLFLESEAEGLLQRMTALREDLASLQKRMGTLSEANVVCRETALELSASLTYAQIEG